MKNLLMLAGFLVGGVGMVFGQGGGRAAVPPPATRAGGAAPVAAQASTQTTAERNAALMEREAVAAADRAAVDAGLKKFDLDFPGGTPRELAAAIQKAMGRPLNVMIPDDVKDTRLPALKMSGVTAASLFRAIESGSASDRVVYREGNSTSRVRSSYGFKTLNPITDDSVWQFFAVGMDEPDKVSKFYSLTPYLENGLTVDDITTAIQTAWKMEGYRGVPTLSYHRETKLLIVVGTYPAMNSVKGVLDALASSAKK